MASGGAAEIGPSGEADVGAGVEVEFADAHFFFSNWV